MTSWRIGFFRGASYVFCASWTSSRGKGWAWRSRVSLTSKAVIALLQGAFVEHGPPPFLGSDNGPEFIALEVTAWLEKDGSSARYIAPGCAWQNGYQESFHGEMRDGLLDREVFVCVAEARVRLQRKCRRDSRPVQCFVGPSLRRVRPQRGARTNRDCVRAFIGNVS
jgi:hypothetical protein